MAHSDEARVKEFDGCKNAATWYLRFLVPKNAYKRGVLNLKTESKLR